MRKKIFFLLLLICPINIFAIDLYSPKFVIYDNTDEKILLEKDYKENTSIASLTKIMTAMVIIDGVDDLQNKITINYQMLNAVPSGAYVIYLQRGEVYTYEDLLYACLLPSAADAATSLAIAYSGSVSSFVEQMNNKAKELGMENTNFTNPIGMDNGNNKSTLEDILTLLKYALNNNDFRTIYSTREYTMSNNKKVFSSLKMYNDDLHLGLDTSRIIGSKTGYTRNAGFALSIVFESNTHEIISITVGAEHNNNSYHLRDGISIINYIDQNYNIQTLLEKNNLLKELEVRDSTIDKYNIYSNRELTKYLPNDYNKNDFKIEFNIPEFIDYKTEKNIGNIKYYFGDELLYTQKVTINEEIKPTFWAIVRDNIIYIIIGFILLISLIIFIILKKKKNKNEEIPVI